MIPLRALMTARSRAHVPNFAAFSRDCRRSQTAWRREGDLNLRDPSPDLRPNCPQVWLDIWPRNKQQCWRDIIAAVSPRAESSPVPNRPFVRKLRSTRCRDRHNDISSKPAESTGGQSPIRTRLPGDVTFGCLAHSICSVGPSRSPIRVLAQICPYEGDPV